MKRLISFYLSVFLVLGILSGCGNNQVEQTTAIQETSQTQTQETTQNQTEEIIVAEYNSELINEMDIPELWKQELHCAEQLGMPMDKVQEDTVSGKDMMELLDWFVGYAAPELLSEWKSNLPAMRNSNAPLSRFDAMTALFLSAEHIGGEYVGHNYDILSLSQTINQNWDIDYVKWDLFGGFESHGQYNCGAMGEGYLDAAAYYYNLGRASYITGEHPFPLDLTTSSFTFDIPPTYADAMLGVVRLMASVEPNLFVAEPTQEELEYVKMADNRREEIHASAADIAETIAGTVYYVSNNGSDSNNGLSPETAWATPQYAFSQKLQTGDAVLLERGGSWIIAPSEEWGLTSSALVIPNGVTVGAYGAGEKPILRGDIESANTVEFWELYSEKDGAKIWKAAQSVRYSPVIVFNEGETYASAVMPDMNNSGQYLSNDGNEFDVTTELHNDLQFCCLLDLTKIGVNTDIENNPEVKGELYLRCDAGNPADVYESIHIPQTAAGLNLQTGVTLDNLSLRYFSCNGAVMDGYDGFYSRNVTNCEVGWCGGLLKNYQENHRGIYIPFAAGGALQCSSTELKVTDNHIHNCGPFALIVAIHNNADNPSACILNYENIYIANNLIEYCGSGIHMGDYADMDIPGTKGYISNFVFENNLVMNSGMGWVRDAIWQYDGGSSPYLSTFENMQGAIDNDGIYLRNNVFYKGAYSLFSLSDYHLNGSIIATLPVFTGNTYIQNAKKPILQKNWSTEVYYPTDEVVKEILGDETGNLVIIGE